MVDPEQILQTLQLFKQYIHSAAQQLRQLSPLEQLSTARSAQPAGPAQPAQAPPPAQSTRAAQLGQLKRRLEQKMSIFYRKY